MTAIVTWNVQCGMGCDGRVNLDRIAAGIGAMGESDVICLQEVARFMPDLDDGTGGDQAAILADRFPDHEPFFGPALDRAGETVGKRRQFGNMILSRLPVIQAFRHPLPRPPDSATKHMSRQATEVVIQTPGGTLRVITTHLEFHSHRQRSAQVEALRSLHQEVCGNVRQPAVDVADGPYAPAARPQAAVLCGDFNFIPTDPEYARMLAPFEDETPAFADASFVDAWPKVHGGTPHGPTCGIFDHDQWPEGPHCRDFFFVSGELVERIESVHVDTKTDASDHQPLRMTLAD